MPTTLGTASGQPSIAGTPARTKSRAIWFVLVVLLLAGGTVAVLFATRGDGGGTSAGTTFDAGPTPSIDARATPSGSDARATPSAIDAGPPLTSADAAPAAVDATPAPSDHDKLVQAARDAAAAGQWQRAAELARALLALDPADPDAKALSDGYFASHTINKKHSCKDQKAAASEAARFWPGDPRAAAMARTAKACKEDKPTDPKPDAGVPDDDGTPTVEQLVQNATDALKTGKYGQALRLCELALLDKPRNPKALSICAMSACKLKNADKAAEYFEKLPRARRKPVKTACQAAGIELGRTKDDPY
jgi:tetratricopeptide (TPR) repeat protein